MRFITYTLITFLVVILMYSCTITKRHFGKGYHIEWRKKQNNQEPETSTFQELDVRKDANLSEITFVDQVSVIQPKTDTEEPISDTTSEKTKRLITKIDSLPSEKIAEEKNLIRSNADDEPLEKTDKKIYPLTWVMMGALTLIIVSYILTILTNPLFAAGIIGFAFIGLILGIFSLIAVRKHPEKYKAKKLTKFFAMFFIISGSIILFASLLYFLTMN